MGRYTIEINDAFVEDCGMKKLLLPIKLNECGSYWLPTGITLTPYTEPDIDAIRKEAYEQGRKDGKIEGQAETWVCVKKIALHPEEGGIALGDIRKIFGCSHFQTVFRDYSASEAIKKIRQYEQEKEEQIHAGDEIRNKQTPDIRICVTDVRGGRWDGFALSDVGNYCRFGSGYNDRYLDGWEKTGRNFAAILQQMRDENVEQK